MSSAILLIPKQGDADDSSSSAPQTIPRNALWLSGLLSDMVEGVGGAEEEEGDGDDDEELAIPLPNVSASTLELVVSYLTHHAAARAEEPCSAAEG